ncbi:uncharacterized protein LOC118800421 isoform X2 [Colossoma macropomum]|uniref:uncharacterized protein LOC118800421 isoform X2 n=1 Tax=Colossoma macropomum TaxID=42526 RepID=UPI001864523C|nr:uncharacterized protein LOC118800421 isoform X2 [Colossoma macropomum]
MAEFGDHDEIKTVFTKPGQDAFLPSHFSPGAGTPVVEIRWFRSTDCIFLYKNEKGREGRDHEGRLSLFTQGPQKGNASLILKDSRESDEGLYRCQVLHGENKEESTVVLYICDQEEAEVDLWHHRLRHALSDDDRMYMEASVHALAELEPQKEKEASLKEVEQPLKEDKREDLEVREQLLIIREKHLEEREKKVELREINVEKRENNVYIREVNVEKRENNATIRENNATTRENNAFEREVNVGKKEAKVAEIETQLDKKAKQLNQREKNLLEKEEEASSATQPTVPIQRRASMDHPLSMERGSQTDLPEAD